MMFGLRVVLSISKKEIKAFFYLSLLVFSVNAGLQPSLKAKPARRIPDQVKWHQTQKVSKLPIIYGITPTYARMTQKADLTRLSQTLLLVENFFWILVEDASIKKKLVKNLLEQSGLRYKHLNAKSPKLTNSDARGVEQRNAALEWLVKRLKYVRNKRGVVYFMDDDNTYSVKLFDEMRKLKRVGVWPVGLVGKLRAEYPIVQAGKVIGFNAVSKPSRPFPIDLAGFAFNTTVLLKHPWARFPRKVEQGFQESVFLQYFTTVHQLEPLAENCSKVYVWHTRTEKPFVRKKSKLFVYDGHIEI